MKTKFPIKRWYEWIFYIIGWITGVTNLLFWAIILFSQLAHKKGERFWSPRTHRIVFWWGVIVTVFVVLISVFMASIL